MKNLRDINFRIITIEIDEKSQTVKYSKKIKT